ncbi:hypothetical protein HKX48_002482 [Thoreauomyces humboldtii]|nr:hypothetical protein HKX48_002482 [Thoreauomyces humboldtii]
MATPTANGTSARKGKKKAQFVKFDPRNPVTDTAATVSTRSAAGSPTDEPTHINSAPAPSALAGSPGIAAVATPQEDDGVELCFICADTVTCYAIGECNHRVCHLCCLRLRALYKQKTCAMCKTELSDVVFTQSDTKQFQDFNLSTMPALDKRLKIHFDTQEIYEDAMILLRFNCPDPGCDVACTGGWKELKDHVRKAHGMLMCELCIRHKKLFTHEHTLYTRALLDRHNKVGDPDDPSFKGHPSCGFCRINFYGQDELFEHCREKHEQCFLCQRNGVRNQYYQNYLEMESHFQNDHYPCYDSECLAQKFVVFNSEIDLKGHELEVHGTHRAKAKGQHLDLNFNYAGSPSRDLEHNQGRRNNPPPAKRGAKVGRAGSSRDSRAPAQDNAPANEASFRRGNSTSLPTSPQHDESQSQVAPHPVQAPASPKEPRRLRPPPGFGSNLSGAEPVRNGSSPEASTSRPSSPPPDPTPYEAAGPPPTNLLPPPAPTTAEEAAVFQKVQHLLNFSTTRIAEFKSLATSFRQSLLSADEFITAFMTLATQNKSGRQLKDTEAEAGIVWRRMADTVPDPEDFSSEAARGKGKGKGIPLALGPRTGGRMKSEMLRAWNDHKARVINDSPAPRAAVASYANSAATPSSVLPAGARVLVIKNKASKQRATRSTVGAASARTAADANASVWERVSKNLETATGRAREEESTPDKALPVTFAGARPAPAPEPTPPSPALPAATGYHYPTLGGSNAPRTTVAPSASAPYSKPSSAGASRASARVAGRVADKAEFPGLPSRPPRPAAARISGRIGGGPSGGSWGEEASQSSSSGPDVETTKKGSKKGVTLMHFG